MGSGEAPRQLIALAACLIVAACGGGESTGPVNRGPPAPVVPPDPLRKIIADRNIRIGVGTAVGSLLTTSDETGRKYDSVVAREFNVIVAENEMKFQTLRPSRGVFNYVRADQMLAFAQANGMRMRGHTLVFNNQLSSWLTSASWTPDTVRAILDQHITNVVTHYRGQLAAWDVVNEAINDGDGTLKSGFWPTYLGRGYIEQAFRTARAADADVALYYNDYNIEAIGAKSDSVYELLEDFKTRGVPVDGVGMQMHLIAGQLPSLSSMEQNFARFAALGLKIQITELDIRIQLPATGTTLDTQAQNYRDIFDLCLRTPACDMVVMWGFTDRSSWIPSTFPGYGDALLFDSNFNPKPAYTAVRTLLLSK